MTTHADVIEAAKKEGWRIEPTARGHVMCYPPEDRNRDPEGNLIPAITSARRVGDRRGVKNFCTAMIRAGLGGGTPQHPYKGSDIAPPTQPDPEPAPAAPVLEKPIISSKSKEATMAENPFFTTERRVIEKTKGELNPAQMLEAFRNFLRDEYHMELPDEAEFKLVCADERSQEMVEFSLTKNTTDVQLEISYEREQKEPLKLTSTVKN